MSTEDLRTPERTPLGALEMLAVNVAAAENELVSRKGQRDRAIYELHRGGYPRAQIAKAARLSTIRVDQIVKERRDAAAAAARLAESGSGA